MMVNINSVWQDLRSLTGRVQDKIPAGIYVLPAKRDYALFFMYYPYFPADNF